MEPQWDGFGGRDASQGPTAARKGRLDPGSGGPQGRMDARTDRADRHRNQQRERKRNWYRKAFQAFHRRLYSPVKANSLKSRPVPLRARLTWIKPLSHQRRLRPLFRE